MHTGSSKNIKLYFRLKEEKNRPLGLILITLKQYFPKWYY